MKTKIAALSILLVTLSFLFLAPRPAAAWSWRNLLFWVKPAPTAVIQVVNVAPIVPLDKAKTDKKYAAWTAAYKKGDITPLTTDKSNFSFTEDELKYLLAQEIASTKKPDLKDPYLTIKADHIEFGAYSLIPYMPGNFFVSGRLVSSGTDVSIDVREASWTGLPISSALVNKLFNKFGAKFFALLRSYPNYQGVNIDISDKKIAFSFK